ncbi:hypothetical protein FVER53590_26528 [Fusarium verticillioides]|nr:hypothetical protein FVER53590_26528 [Fusarium verticillioides]
MHDTHLLLLMMYVRARWNRPMRKYWWSTAFPDFPTCGVLPFNPPLVALYEALLLPKYVPRRIIGGQATYKYHRVEYLYQDPKARKLSCIYCSVQALATSGYRPRLRCLATRPTRFTHWLTAQRLQVVAYR